MISHLFNITIVDYIPWLILVFMGSCWGFNFSLAKIATGAGGSAFGIAFWQAAISALIIYCFSLSRNPFQFPKTHLRLIVVVALLGAAIPSVLFFLAASHVPAGVLAITTALVPGVTYALAIPMRIEVPSFVRFSGVVLGAISILLLVLPETSLPTPESVPWVLLACVASSCYSIENIVLSNDSAKIFGPVRLAWGMNFCAALILLPFTVYLDGFIMPRFPFSTLEYSIFGIGILNACAYTLFIVSVQNYGPIFASQTGYIVTISGVIWGIILFEEDHSVWVWASFVTIITGLVLVNPKKTSKALSKKHRI